MKRMRRLRIAVYHNLHSGGAKRVTAEHLRRLASHHDVTLFTLSTADLAFAGADELPIDTVVEPYSASAYLRSPFGRLNPLIVMRNLQHMDAVCKRVAGKIDAGNFDVALVHPCQMTQAPMVLNWLRTPSLYYCHELPRRLYEPEVQRPYKAHKARRALLDRYDPIRKRTLDALKAWDYDAATKATRIVANSQYTRSNVERAYRRNVDVCPPGVDAQSFQPRDLPRVPMVLSVGALTPNKGFDFIIQAVATIEATQRPDIRIISNYQEPQELTFLTALAAQQNVRVTFNNRVTEAELRDAYAQAGCLAYAPVREPFGLAALEAMAAGAPVVGVNEGGVRETIVDGVTGVLAPRNATEFGQRIMEVLRNPERAGRFATAARKHVLSRFNWDTHMQLLERLLEETALARQAGRVQAFTSTPVVGK